MVIRGGDPPPSPPPSNSADMARDNYGSIGKVDKDEEEEDEETCPPSSPCCQWWGCRHTFSLLSFLGMANVYAMRVNLSVAIVAMVGGRGGREKITILRTKMFLYSIALGHGRNESFGKNMGTECPLMEEEEEALQQVLNQLI